MYTLGSLVKLIRNFIKIPGNNCIVNTQAFVIVIDVFGAY